MQNYEVVDVSMQSPEPPALENGVEMYIAAEVDADTARLKDENKRLCDVDTENQALECAADNAEAEIDLLKAALRWALCNTPTLICRCGRGDFDA